MDILPLGLILIAAFLHAFWNYAAKGADEPQAMLQAALWASLIIFAPAFAYRLPSAKFAPGAWLFILATGVLHSLYFYALGRAYRSGDLSRVYPLARGSAPVLVVGIAALFLGERISPTGGLAIFLVVSGILVSHFDPAGRAGWLSLLREKESGARWALATGLVTAAYSVVDKAGVARVSPDVYIYFMFILTALFNLPLQLTRGRASFAGLPLSETRFLFRAAAAGFCMMGAYGLVLFAMQLSKVSYVVAAREVSVIIGSALGVFVLKEGGARQKLAGASLVAAGLVLLAISK
ncbi:EamA family transporter [Nitrospinota bacterium]